MSDKNVKTSREKQEKSNENNADAHADDSDESDAHDGSSDGSGSESSGSGASRRSDSVAECPICLRSLTSQNIGYPEDCASQMHIFCALCIEEWSKNVTTCPIDRQEFSSICILESWTNRNVVRTVKVERKEYNEEEHDEIDEDLTYCEICQLANREHMMLLCDDCDKGFHMDCLTPALRQIPLGSWYCTRCDPEAVAEKNSSESEEDIPRIIRTRQTERIRTAILVRNRLATPEPEPGPSSSRRSTIESTLDRVRRRLTHKRRRTGRRRSRRVRVTVEEFDIDSDDEKFPIRRTSKTIRKRKTKRRKGKRKQRKTKETCSTWTATNGDGNTAVPVSELGFARYRAGIPALRLFEPSNSLDYFSDEAHDEEAPCEQSVGNVMTVIRNVRPIGGGRRLLKQKVAITAPPPDPVNILDLIMDTQEKFHSKGEMSLKNGKPVFKPNNNAAPVSSVPNITQAPLGNGIGAGNESVPVQNSNNQQEANMNNNSTQCVAGSTATGSDLGGGQTALSGSGGDKESNGRPIRFSYVPLSQTTKNEKKSTDIFEDEDNCPNFSVYSSETMSLAQKPNKADEEVTPAVETDVDLVQLSGGEDEEEPKETPASQSKWKPIPQETQKEEQERTRVLHLYDSDGDNIDEWNKEREAPKNAGGAEQENVPMETDAPQTPERSYTPCLDENHPKDLEGSPAKISEGAATATSAGIDGMDTELISEEEDSNLNENLEAFRRGTKARDRNYREKRSKTPTRKSGSVEDKENQKRAVRGSRKEIARYDVRNVIARTTQRDPFGRNKERNRSRSRTPTAAQRKSRSQSTHSRSVSRKSFTISRSPSYDRPATVRRGSKRSSSPKRRSVTPRRRLSSPRKRSLSRSRSPKRRQGDLPRRRNSRSPAKKRKPKKDRRRKQKPIKEKRRVRSRSPLQRWSRDASPITPPVADKSWTPPIVGALPKTAENLRVVVNNRESPTRTKKKDKKKKSGKKKEKRRDRTKHRRERTDEPTTRTTAAASKEVFASGDNILVSVSFNNVQEKQKTPERRVERDPSRILQLPVPVVAKPRRHRKTDAKPVAIIDLDGSPFNEIQPSPVIILSDSDHENGTEPKNKNTEVTLDEVIRPASPPESPTAEEQFRAGGPKTPPEPPQIIKFSVPVKQNRLRQMNTLFEAENDVSDDAQNELQSQKIGPNTPPEPTPTSPDVYDPFEPTKSPSEHSDRDHDDGPIDDGPPSRSSTPPLEETEANLNKEVEKSVASMNPVDLVMSLISKSTAMAHDKDVNQSIESMDEATNAADDAGEKQIQVLSSVVVTPAKSGGGGVSAQYLHPRTAVAASTTTQHKLPTPTYKATKAKTHATTVISKLPLPRKPETVDIDSPYSPGSSDFDDLFEPPSSTTDTYKPVTLHKQHNVTSTSNNRAVLAAANKIDMFDNLFGSTSPIHKFSTVTSTYKTKASRKRRRRSRKIDDDEIPSSAVELQVKDKLLNKLNRQERVIEEVKLVIKPHYNKKRITKEEYKEIMRKAVPKICHSKSGEINPVKIQALVEAYVKKVRYRRKHQMKTQAT